MTSINPVELAVHQLHDDTVTAYKSYLEDSGAPLEHQSDTRWLLDAGSLAHIVMTKLAQSEGFVRSRIQFRDPKQPTRATISYAAAEDERLNDVFGRHRPTHQSKLMLAVMASTGKITDQLTALAAVRAGISIGELLLGYTDLSVAGRDCMYEAFGEITELNTQNPGLPHSLVLQNSLRPYTYGTLASVNGGKLRLDRLQRELQENPRDRAASYEPAIKEAEFDALTQTRRETLGRETVEGLFTDGHRPLDPEEYTSKVRIAFNK